MIRQIAVLGAGTMGHGIAETFALHGYPVKLYDVSEEMRAAVLHVMARELSFMAENGLTTMAEAETAVARITVLEDLYETVKDADYVIESAPEELTLKQELFREMDAYCKPDCILASNTSTLPLSRMTAMVSPSRQAYTMVCHWYNPPHLMPIAELSFFGNMSEEIYKTVEALYTGIEKQTVKVLKDVPGLVANRLQQGLAREAFSIMEQGIAAPEDVDKALKFGPAFRYATTGQLEVADMGGLDIWCISSDNLLAVIDNRREANPLLRQKVHQGRLGLKSGEGFFKYPPEQREQVKNEFYKRLIVQLQASKNYIVK